ncbi:hypothetical protein PSR33_00230 [Latilactobacillus curvatus]|uniref:Uncharacterized protein n=1 Tax=Latilactobacillus curvatus TaxID=28038 RepID=A0AAJ5RFP8_LATCU|nr:hypothetical protein [Latilactobacillus curvatus]MDG2984615.1 hypothetical protein [Latilactobacillus curvatus]WDC92002.1 hypothetical protein PSR33_00230 [Latilactobacillus curvatus]
MGKLKMCKMPGCEKERYEPKMLFCGEHERKFKQFVSKSSKSILGVATLAVAFIAKVMADNKGKK